MNMSNAQYRVDDSSILNYYEIGTAKDKLLLLHAQGTNSFSFNNVIAKLAKHYHVWTVPLWIYCNGTEGGTDADRSTRSDHLCPHSACRVSESENPCKITDYTHYKTSSPN